MGHNFKVAIIPHLLIIDKWGIVATLIERSENAQLITDT